MNEQPTQGPSVVTEKKPRTTTPRFRELIDRLQQWRSDDHEDNTVLCRSHVIEILEGIDALEDGRCRVLALTNEMSWDTKTRGMSERIRAALCATP
jgi:hypothetical protein